ncbi:hypothetical protein [Actinomyces culturomici]|uniref:hypothetical protein n=1 Tax=Actinomyces culturomici TaxID=1926276 RepID=UPI000E201002|nr:hypothetical protein [Actinomyces culturomici]
MSRLINVNSGVVVNVDEAMAATLGGQWATFKGSVEKLPVKIKRSLGIDKRTAHTTNEDPVEELEGDAPQDAEEPDAEDEEPEKGAAS